SLSALESISTSTSPSFTSRPSSRRVATIAPDTGAATGYAVCPTSSLAASLTSYTATGTSVNHDPHAASTIATIIIAAKDRREPSASRRRIERENAADTVSPRGYNVSPTVAARRRTQESILPAEKRAALEIGIGAACMIGGAAALILVDAVL